MKIDPALLLETINTKIRERSVFKQNREELVRMLIIAADRTQMELLLSRGSANMLDQLINQFRVVLKFIFSVDNVNGVSCDDPDKAITEISKMLCEFATDYTPIRNYLDQCILGLREIRYDENEKKYIEDTYDDFSNYARILDKTKIYPDEELKADVSNRIGNYLSNEKYKPKLFSDLYLQSLLGDYKKICWLDSEIKFDCDFGDFTYEDLISFCAALKMMGDYYLVMSNNPYKRLDPCVEYNSLVQGMVKLTGLAKTKVERFLEYQFFDYEYQKDKLTLIQSLIKCGDNIYFFPITLNLGLLPIKMYRLVYDHNKEKYRKQISFIANQKEKQMTDEIVEKIQKYDLSLKLNYILKEGKNELAEYDMLALDNKTNVLYIFEFKWHFVGDGEREHQRIDEIIENEINHRKEKDKYILENPQLIGNLVFGGKKINGVSEILISQNFSGNRRHEMTVIDFETLQWSVDRHDSFEELMNYFISGEFRQSIPLKNERSDVEIEGYKFNFFRPMFKTS